MSSRRRSMSPRNKRPAPRAYGDFSRGDRGDRYDKYDRNDRNEDHRRGRDGYRDRERYQDRNERYSRYDDRPRVEQRLTDDFGRDIPRDSYREEKREEEGKVGKIDNKSEQIDKKESTENIDSKEVTAESKTDLKPATTPVDSSEAPKSKSKKKKGKKSEPDPMTLGDSDEEFQRMMGMSSASFGTTKHKKVAGNQVGGVSKPKATQYRQYMNRVGGFNRALSPERK